jgi:glycosyltransferase involved in cell wall biosynthesis
LQKQIPIVWTFHEGEITGGTKDALREMPLKRVAYSRGLKRFVARRVDAVIVVAEHLRAPLNRPDAVYLPAGVDLDLFVPMETGEARNRIGLRADRRYLLFPSSPGRVEKRYGLARQAVEILKQTAHEAQDVELIALDNIPHERVPLYMNASELMVMTSAFEASPVTIREALACNVPVVSTDVGDAHVILDGVQNCRVVEADPPRIAEALRATLSGPRRIQSRDRMQRYALSAGVERLVDLYRELVRRKERP